MKFTGSNLMRTGAVAVGFGMLLTACVVVDGPPRPAPPPRDPGPACTMEYDPVCGERRGVRDTYGNACVARAEGARIVHAGECRRAGRPPEGRPPQGRPPQSRPPQGRPPQACTREYAPVCATRRGDRRSFGNACEAESAGYRIIRRGEC